MPLPDDVAKVRDILTRGVRRAARRDGIVLAELAQRPPVPDGTVEIAVYFTDAKENLYQIDQWFEPLRRLHERHHVTVLVPQLGDHRASSCGGSPVPVAPRATPSTRSRSSSGASGSGRSSTSTRTRQNFAAMRFADPAHVFICHGESDKDYMSSNQLKAYDRVFIAGTAARERITAQADRLRRGASRRGGPAPGGRRTTPGRR